MTSRRAGSSAFDGDPATAWSTAFGAPVGQWIDVTTAAPVTFDHLDLEVVADGKHSVPTQLQIDAGGESRTVDVPAIPDGKVGDAPVKVPVTFAPLTGSDVRVTVTGVREVSTLDYAERVPRTMPVAIAEVGIPGVRRAAMPAQLPAECRDDLVVLDGTVVPMTLDGSTADAAAGRPVDLAPCPATAAAGGVALDRGDHTVRSLQGTQTGIDVDGMVFGSDAGGTGMALGPRGELPTSVTQAAATRGRAAAREGHEQGQFEDRAHGERSAQGHAVLVGARTEPERGLGGVGRGHRDRRVDAGRRLRQRLARRSAVGHIRRDPHLDATDQGVDRAGDLGGGGAAVPRARAPSPTCAGRCRTTTSRPRSRVRWSRRDHNPGRDASSSVRW